MAVVHAHAEDTLAFGVADATKLRPVIHSVIKYPSQGEIDARNRGYNPYSTEAWRKRPAVVICSPSPMTSR
jgi:hypothetical protein